MTYKFNNRLAHPFYGDIDPDMLKKARELRKNLTFTEKVLWKELRRRNLMGFKFRRQHPIKTFIADFYCNEAKLVIEIDGGYHNDDDQKAYDQGRTSELNALGIRVLRFSNNEVLKDIDNVIIKIWSVLIKDHTPSP